MGTTLNEGQGAIQNDLGVGKSVQRLTQSRTEITHANPEDDLSVLWLQRRVFGMSSEKVIWGECGLSSKSRQKLVFSHREPLQKNRNAMLCKNWSLVEQKRTGRSRVMPYLRNVARLRIL